MPIRSSQTARIPEGYRLGSRRANRHVGEVFAVGSFLLEVFSKPLELRIVAILRKLTKDVHFQSSFEDTERAFIECRNESQHLRFLA